MKVVDVMASGPIKERASILQSKTQKPVRFEISEGTRASVEKWMEDEPMVDSEYLWPGRFHERLHISTRGADIAGQEGLGHHEGRLYPWGKGGGQGTGLGRKPDRGTERSEEGPSLMSVARETLEAEILALITEFSALDRPDVTSEMAFETLSVSSLDVLQIIFRLEEAHGIAIDTEAFHGVKTVGDIVDYIHGHQVA